ncbi:MAG: YraN family protein [Burkholderiaceae bacterium]
MFDLVHPDIVMLPWRKGKPAGTGRRVPWRAAIVAAATGGKSAMVRTALDKRQEGEAWEQRAAAWLIERGLQAVDANVGFRCGEIDLIMACGRTAVIVEVRRRRCAGHGSAADSIDHRKRRKITHAAQAWWERTGHRRFTHLRFDVVTFEQNGEPVWVCNAWTETGWL